MSYEDIRIEGSLIEALESWLVRRYGNVVEHWPLVLGHVLQAIAVSPVFLVIDFCPGRILDQLSPTEDVLATHWRERCRDHTAETTRSSAFSMNS